MQLIMTDPLDKSGNRKEHFQLDDVIDFKDCDVAALSKHFMDATQLGYRMDQFKPKDPSVKACAELKIKLDGARWRKRPVALSVAEIFAKVTEARMNGHGYVDLRRYTGTKAFDFRLRP